MSETATKQRVDRRGQFNITGVDLRLLVQKAFALSSPQGLGFLHHEPGGLTDHELDQIVGSSRAGELEIDYLRGRSMKFYVFYEPDTQQMFFDLDWYDHGRWKAEQLMRDINLPDVENAIGEARAGKLAREQEHEARGRDAALTLLRLIADGDGTFPDNAYRLEHDNPVRKGWTVGAGYAEHKEWIRTKDWKTFWLTEAGQKALKESAHG